jgi:hypothetical protein
MTLVHFSRLCGSHKLRATDRSLAGLSHQRFALALSGQAEKYRQCPVQSNDIFVIQLAKSLADPRLRHGSYFIDHQPGGTFQAIAIGWFDQHSQQGSLGRIGRKHAERDRTGCFESVLLHNDRRTRLTRIRCASRHGPNLTAFHAPRFSVAESINRWSIWACLLDATAVDCVRAAVMNERARTSGTHICTGLNPWARRRSRCNRTFSREDRGVFSMVFSGRVTCNLPDYFDRGKNAFRIRPTSGLGRQPPPLRGLCLQASAP